MANRIHLTLLALPVLLLACEGSERALPGWDNATAVGTSLAFTRSGDPEVALLDLSGSEPKAAAQRVSLPLPVRSVVARLGDHAELLVTSATDAEEDDSRSTLTIIDAEGETRSGDVDPFLSRMRTSDDGRFAVRFGLYGASGLLTNRSQVEVTDLDLLGSSQGAPRTRTLPTLGGQPEDVTFLPELTFAGEPTRLLFVRSSDAFSLLDLARPERPEVSVELPQWARSVGRQAARVVTDEDGGRLYLYRPGSAELLVIDLVPRAGDEMGFRPVLGTLSAPFPLQDVEPYRLNGEPRLACATTAGVVVINPERGTSAGQSTDQPAQSVQVYEQAGAFSGPHAIISTGSTVAIADLYGLEPGGLRLPLRTVVSGATVTAVTLYETDGVAIVSLNEAGIDVVDLARQTATPFASSAPIRNQLYDGERGGVWLSAAEDKRVAFFEFETQRVSEIELDAPVQEFVSIPASGFIAALHADEAGHVTLLDADNPTRRGAVALHGFLASGFGD